MVTKGGGAWGKSYWPRGAMKGGLAVNDQGGALKGGGSRQGPRGSAKKAVKDG